MDSKNNGIAKHTMKIVLVLVFVFFSIMTKGQMFNPSSFNSLIIQNSYVFVLAIGMLMCMLIKGNIDLSVGSVVCFIDAVGAALMVNAGVPIWMAMLIMLIFGLIIGAVLGSIIAFLNVPPWIATLAGYLAFRGWGTRVLNNGTIGGIPSEFVNLFFGYVPDLFHIEGFNLTCLIIGCLAVLAYIVSSWVSRKGKMKKGYEVEDAKSFWLRNILVAFVVILVAVKLAMYKGIPYTLVWVVVIALVYNFIISRTTLGRVFYAMGGNVEATRLSGINTKKVLFLAYFNMQFLTVVAAWMTMARQAAANPTAGQNYEMDAISACIVGGVSAYGGSGSIPGMIVGAVLIGVINLGMSIMGIDANWQKFVKGVVLLAAVVFEIYNKRTKKQKKSIDNKKNAETAKIEAAN